MQNDTTLQSISSLIKDCKFAFSKLVAYTARARIIRSKITGLKPRKYDLVINGLNDWYSANIRFKEIEAANNTFSINCHGKLRPMIYELPVKVKLSSYELKISYDKKGLVEFKYGSLFRRIDYNYFISGDSDKIFNFLLGTREPLANHDQLILMHLKIVHGVIHKILSAMEERLGDSIKDENERGIERPQVNEHVSRWLNEPYKIKKTKKRPTTSLRTAKEIKESVLRDLGRSRIK